MAKFLLIGQANSVKLTKRLQLINKHIQPPQKTTIDLKHQDDSLYAVIPSTAWGPTGTSYTNLCHHKIYIEQVSGNMPAWRV